VSVRISSGDAEAVITGDLAHHPIEFAEPQWDSLADVDHAFANRTRAEFVEEYADSGVLVIGTHFAGPTAGYLVREAKGVRFRVA
jgi:thioester reductase-like protein